MIIDTHTHYDDDAYDEDRDSMLQALTDHGIVAAVDIGASMTSTAAAVALAHKYNHIYAAVGVHPSETEGLTEHDMDVLKAYASDPKVVAIGEIGLDYHWPDPDRQTQKKWFTRQMQLAREVKLPVVIHSRDAAADTLDMMKAEHAEDIGGVVHCYSYNVELAKEYLKMGFYFGIGGVVTFKNSKKLKETVEYLPMESIVLETDCPYLAPDPHRGSRNDSMNLVYVIREIAALKDISVEEVEKVTYNNARRLYAKLG